MLDTNIERMTVAEVYKALRMICKERLYIVKDFTCLLNIGEVDNLDHYYKVNFAVDIFVDGEEYLSFHSEDFVDREGCTPRKLIDHIVRHMCDRASAIYTEWLPFGVVFPYDTDESVQENLYENLLKLDFIEKNVSTGLSKTWSALVTNLYNRFKKEIMVGDFVPGKYHVFLEYLYKTDIDDVYYDETGIIISDYYGEGMVILLRTKDGNYKRSSTNHGIVKRRMLARKLVV